MSESVLQRDRLQALLKAFMAERGNHYHLSKLGFFGSYARNQATAKSDVDIVFDTEQPNLLMTAMMQQDLEALLGRQVDIVRLNRYLHPSFRAQIEKEAVYV
ncbi:MAG: nucleotidyltransferase domain-containing protein [Phormidesmis sp.]